MSDHSIILAAGKGTRMQSSLPKALHQLAGCPLLARVLKTAKFANCSHNVVIGYQAELIQSYFAHHQDINWVYQNEQLGTAHATKTALATMQYSDDDKIIILYGDVPLISTQTVVKILAEIDRSSPLVVLSCFLSDPTGYGRIVRDTSKQITAIVEEKDADATTVKIREVNSGIMGVRAGNLSVWLDMIQNNNAQQEYYLTDLVNLAVTEKFRIKSITDVSKLEIYGVNSPQQLHELERNYQCFMAEKLLTAGVRIMDINRIDIRGELACGKNVQIDVNCVFVGNCRLGDDVKIGANTIIINSSIDDNSCIEPFCHIEGAKISTSTTIGPYARIRSSTIVRAKAKIGNFVEVKKSTIGVGSKVSHLSYIGDTLMGNEVNVGAGTITCNYDGEKKHQTIIEDDVFIGSNSSLIAPVTLENNSIIGAASVITKDAPANKVSLTRVPQTSYDVKL